MTKEEAIEMLKKDKEQRGNCFISDALDMAIKALEQEPCTQEKQANADKIDAVYIDGFKAGYSQARFDLEQKPCEDAISRAEVLDLIDSKDPNYEVRHFKEDVECLDPVSVAEKTGRWILKRKFQTKLKLHDEYLSQYGCSECYRTIRCTESQLINYPFCHCGARMVVDEPVDKTNESVDELKND